MLKTFKLLLRGAAAAAEEDLVDRNALLILDQQIREVATGIEASKRALALAMAQESAEARRLADAEMRLTDLEARAVAALQGGREDLAGEAAQAIVTLEAERDAARTAHAGLRDEVASLRRAHLDAGRRLDALHRGRRVAQAAEAVRRLRAGRLRDAGERSTLAEAEATLARLRARQGEDAAADAALDVIEEAAGSASAEAAANKLAAAGFGPRTAPSLDDVMARLRAKAAPSAATAMPAA
ncbi:MAG TPA: PspA/IM30 family protein [Beijerinckiaceae bacterium]|jgi:phage shock protein A